MKQDVILKIIAVGTAHVHGVGKKAEKVYEVYYKPLGFLNWFSSWKVLVNVKNADSVFHTKKDIQAILKEILLDENNIITYIK